jgi:FMN phosphatase YigB (HAD superfamily)
MSAPKKIEALLFDMGGIVIEIDFDLALQAWKQWTLLSIEEMRHRFKLDEAYEQHERGEIEAAEYFSHLRKVLGIEANDIEIASGWNAIFVDEISETLNYILSAKNHLPCFAFTNSNSIHQASWMSNFPAVVDSFHQIFVSSELGLRKPEREAFAAIADATGISLDAMLFFDDTEENIRGAQAVGMQAVHVKEPLDVKLSLVELGVI